MENVHHHDLCSDGEMHLDINLGFDIEILSLGQVLLYCPV